MDKAVRIFHRARAKSLGVPWRIYRAELIRKAFIEAQERATRDLQPARHWWSKLVSWMIR